ncbi:response regulator [Streptomyces sp. SA15]|uniref:response regulator transcription factor n=1 Tax=Streptomyces sp. SA15 TaxID=934019 RepID=UPI000BAED8CB|nr:response regulator transcription factor [Streptomyces sp. SA15]PAZ13044.1 response regulator [Streptomyces sp. SA15]
MKRVLVVEPHPQALAALTDLVEDEPGCELVGAVTTVAEAIQLVNDVIPDVVLVDADASNWQSHRLGHQLGELLPKALLVLLSAATDPRQECPKSSAKTPPITILKTAAPEFLRSLSA